ncbi:MAG: phage holin family protein [Candidatus Obscuribacterales bacterium]|nr:phage holin family protein [Candidatus Obscuribacterales bacterium]
MKTFIIRLILSACAFQFILPMLPGFHWHGNFLNAIGAGLFFAIAAWVIEVLAISLSILLTITSFGMALLYLIPIWLIGFWLVPAVVLKLTAELIPAYLTIAGWIPAIWGGFVMLLIGAITSDGKKICRLDV